MTTTLDSADAEALRDLPRNFAARQLLTGARGPLGGAGFPPDVADAAYLGWVAYNIARHGMLRGRPAYEASGTVASRIRNAAHRARSLESWGFELLKSLNLRADRLAAEDQRWWREVCALDAEGSVWRRLRTAEAMQDVASATGILVSERWLWDLYKDTEQTATSAEGVEA